MTLTSATQECGERAADTVIERFQCRRRTGRPIDRFKQEHHGNGRDSYGDE